MDVELQRPKSRTTFPCRRKRQLLNNSKPCSVAAVQTSNMDLCSQEHSSAGGCLDHIGASRGILRTRGCADEHSEPIPRISVTSITALLAQLGSSALSDQILSSGTVAQKRRDRTQTARWQHWKASKIGKSAGMTSKVLYLGLSREPIDRAALLSCSLPRPAYQRGEKHPKAASLLETIDKALFG